MEYKGDVEIRFANNLKYYMEINGLRQVDVADKLDIKTNTLSGWVTGNRLPRLGDVVMLAEFFNVTVDALLTGIPGDKPKSISSKELYMAKQFYEEEGLQLLYKVFMSYKGKVLMALAKALDNEDYD